MRYFIWSIFLIVVFFLSCSKEKTDPVQIGKKTPGYIQLKIGNTWVYQHFDIDTNGISTPTNRFDTVVVSRSFIHRGQEYFVLYGPNAWGIQQIKSEQCFCRDSSGYLVDTSGIIRFASNDFRDSIYVYYEIISNNFTIHTDVMQMRKVDGQVELPAGIFSNVLNYHGEHRMYVSIPDNVPNPRDWNQYYAPGVGLIMENYFYSQSPEYSERRLVSFQAAN